MTNFAEKAPRGAELLSNDSVRFAVQVTGGPRLWSLWRAGSGQDLAMFPRGSLTTKLPPISVSLSGRNIESDARLFRETAERWRATSDSVELKPRRTPLGRRLDKIRKHIKASGQPLMSWEDIDRELAEHRVQE